MSHIHQNETNAPGYLIKRKSDGHYLVLISPPVWAADPNAALLFEEEEDAVRLDPDEFTVRVNRRRVITTTVTTEEAGMPPGGAA